MSINRQIFLGAVGLLVLVAVMAWLFIWPGYREAALVRAKVNTLKAKMAGLQHEHQQVQRLAGQVEQMRQQASREYKVIPESPEVAELMRKLSLPVDGVTVLDQTFNTGSPEDVNLGDAEGLRAMPLKVEMSATFESIFALLRAVESMDQLMRVSSVKVICKRDEKAAGSPGSDVSPVLNASVSLEALYDPPVGEEGEDE